VIIDAIKRVIAAKKEVTRENVRDAIHSTKLMTLQGEVSFDANGDIVSKIVSVYQYKRNPAKPVDDEAGNSVYLGVAPESPQT